MEQKTHIEIRNGINYQVSYRQIRYPRLEFKSGDLLVVLPKSGINVDEFIKKHERWIINKTGIIKQAVEEAKVRKLQMRPIDYNFKSLVSSLSLDFCREYGFKVNKLYIRRMNSKWASYSKRGNLTVNILLKYLPDSLINYVIFHEVAHSFEREHNKRFWRILSKKFPTYRNFENDLLVYWFLIKQTQSSEVIQ